MKDCNLILRQLKTDKFTKLFVEMTNDQMKISDVNLMFLKFSVNHLGNKIINFSAFKQILMHISSKNFYRHEKFNTEKHINKNYNKSNVENFKLFMANYIYPIYFNIKTFVEQEIIGLAKFNLLLKQSNINKLINKIKPINFKIFNFYTSNQILITFDELFK